ncbi:MAG: XisH family protein [Acidobacteria bacterium]|nr:XisH family protein [Acidobacteriota bacterium]
MPRLDIIHQTVKNAIIKDGWTVTHDPYLIQYKEVKMFADLAAEKSFAAEREGQKIVVEIKSFVGASKLQDLKIALGQYDIYRSFLKALAPERKLYVAISEKAYQSFFSKEAIQLVIHTTVLPLIVVNLQREEIVRWIN